jgi:hypothetical protein
MRLARAFRHLLQVVGGLSLLAAAGCDNTTTSTYTECHENQVGDVVHRNCCTTTCTYDNDCYYYYGGDCDVSCVQTCYDDSATPVRTAVYRTPASPPPSPTPTPSPAASTRIDIGAAVAAPGDPAVVTVSLIALAESVAATGNDISFDPNVLALEPSNCLINPTIGKSLIASVVEDVGSTKTLRLFVSSSGTADAIPDGPLYTCTFAIAPSALPGTYPLSNGNPLAFAPDGSPLDDVVGGDGSVIVSLVVGPSPTPTETH